MATEKADGLAKAAVENIKSRKKKRRYCWRNAKQVGNEISGIRMSQVFQKSLDASARDIIDDESHGSVG